MSATKRHKRGMRAIEEGKQARIRGQFISDCPYKRSEWGLGSYWQHGWAMEDQKGCIVAAEESQ